MACLAHTAAAALLPLGQMRFALAVDLSYALGLELAQRAWIVAGAAWHLAFGWPPC